MRSKTPEPNSSLDIGIAESPYLTTPEAARYCRFDDCVDPTEAFLKWARRFAVPGRRRGRELLWTRAALEKFLRDA